MALQLIGPRPPFLDINVAGVVNERDACEILATVQDDAGVAIPGTALTAMTLTLYDQATDSVINNRQDVDIRSKVDALGAMKLTLYSADNPVVTEGASGTKERHVGLIHYEWDDPVKDHSQEVLIDVVRMHRVGAE